MSAGPEKCLQKVQECIILIHDLWCCGKINGVSKTVKPFEMLFVQ